MQLPSLRKARNDGIVVTAALQRYAATGGRSGVTSCLRRIQEHPRWYPQTAFSGDRRFSQRPRLLFRINAELHACAATQFSVMVAFILESI